MRDDGNETTEQRASASLRRVLRAMNDLGPVAISVKNGATAKNVMLEDIGHFGEASMPYGLEQKHRDILLAHGRQDSAHALLNTISMLDEIKSLSRQVRLLQVTGLLVLFAVGLLVWKLH